MFAFLKSTHNLADLLLIVHSGFGLVALGISFYSLQDSPVPAGTAKAIDATVGVAEINPILN